MQLFDISAALLALAALFSWVNARFIHLPTTIGVMLIALVFSLLLISLSFFGVDAQVYASKLLAGIDFNITLMYGMLSFLLFAGALHININDLRQQAWVVLTLATLGVIISTFIVAVASWLLLNGLGFSISFIYCLLFGALISPTDPIAVMAMLKSVGTPKSLETKIAGESLFNDGVAVVVFIIILRLATGGETVQVSSVVGLFLVEAIGGGVLGFVAGYGVYRMLRTINNYQVEVLLTLGLVMGTYSLAHALHVSGPIAIVVAGLLIGNHGRTLAMSDKTREHLDTFWELMDEILNAVLFVLIGLEILVLTFNGQYWLAGLLTIPIVLIARFVSVAIPITLMKWRRKFTPGVIKILTWAGLRGGISVALALSIPASPERTLILALTYTVVLFSIIVQGLTIKRLFAGLEE